MKELDLDRPIRGRRPLPFTIVVILANLAVMLVAMIFGGLRNALLFDGALVWHGQIWRVFTHAWVHTGWVHCVGNMAAFLPFAMYIEFRWSQPRLVAAYVSCCIGSGLFLTVLSLVSPQRALGASGAVAGLMMLWLAAVISRAGKKWYVVLPELTLGVVVAVFYVAKVVLWDITHLLSNDQISHWTHLGGFLTGFLLFRAGLLPKGEHKRANAPPSDV